MRRRLWLKDPRTGAQWDFTPDNRYGADNGCMLTDPSGFGYEADIKTYDVMNARFVEQISRKTPDVSGALHFISQAHVERFVKFIGDFTLGFELHCSFDGVVPEDRLTKTWYKNVIIKKMEKGALNEYSWFEVPITFHAMSIWRRDVDIPIELKEPSETAGLTYPFTYPFFFDGIKWMAEVRNDGLEAPLRIELSNVGRNPEWLVVPMSGEYQRGKFNVSIGENEVLVVDSNPEAQLAQVVSGVYSEPVQVYDLQEPDLDYINFVVLPHGDSTIAFALGNNTGAAIKVTYSEQREVM